MSAEDIWKTDPKETDDDLRRLAALPDNEIDFSDIPEITGEPLPQRGLFYRPIKKPVTIRLDADVIDYFKRQGGLYQRAINDVLRNHVYPQNTQSIFGWLQSRLGRHSRKDAIIDLYNQFNGWGLKDVHFDTEIGNGCDATLWQRISEMCVAHKLKSLFYPVTSKNDGPDFLIEQENRKIWIEVVCPSPRDALAAILTDEKSSSQVYTQLMEKILLRYTAAIKEKKEKFNKYLETEKVGKHDICIIAISAAQLGYSQDAFIGISQRPAIVEAVLPLGPLQVNISRATGAVSSLEGSHRDSVPNHNNAPVLTDSFLNEAYKGISAVMAFYPTFDASNCWAMVHNPNATNPAPKKSFGCRHEYVATVSQANIEIQEI
jgi:uncharacterized protein (DUF4415 family)